MSRGLSPIRWKAGAVLLLPAIFLGTVACWGGETVPTATSTPRPVVATPTRTTAPATTKTPAGAWIAPAEARKLRNAVAANESSIAAGKKVYQANCLACHGAKGVGNGDAGANLTPRPADLTSTIVQMQTDGELFWKITNGRTPMPSWEQTLSEEDRWNVVNYIRTLAPRGK